MEGFPVPTLVWAALEGSTDVEPTFKEHTSKRGEMVHTKTRWKAAVGHGSARDFISRSHYFHLQGSGEGNPGMRLVGKGVILTLDLNQAGHCGSRLNKQDVCTDGR